PVLAGSAAYAVCESRGWRIGLEHKPREAGGFYTVIGLSVLIGVAVDYSPVDPIRARFWSAVLNGVISVPLMAATMIVVSRRDAMGQFTAPLPLCVAGWLATACMAAAAVGMFVLS